MANKLFKSFFAVALVLGSALGFVACEDKGDGVVADPKVEVSTTSLNFTMEEGSQSVELTANSDWKVEVDDADWVTVTPTAGKGDATLTVAVAMNDSGAVRTSIVKVIALHKEYGNWDTKKITVSQSASETPTVEEELLYGDDFDAEEATKTYGSGSSWPYLDQFPQFANPEGPAAENVTYSGKGVSIRANSTSDSQCSDYAGSGSNNIFFGSSAYFQVNNITLAEGQQNLKLTFGSEKYTQDGDSTFKNEEFHIYLSKDGNGWAEIKEYTFAGTEGGRWNVATAEFSLTSVPETLYLKFAADVASVYRLDDVKLFSGNGGQTIDLDNIEAPEPVEVKKVTVAEFLAAAEDSTIYELTGEITNVTNTTYGNFYLKDSTGEVLIYGLCSPTGEQKYWAESGAKVGDTITVQTVRTSYNGTPQGKDAIFVSLVPGEGGQEPNPEPAEGPYASDAPFVCSTDDSTNAVYSLGATTIDGYSVTGFKLGKGKQTGLFKSGAVGVSGDKYLNLYAVAWKGGDAKLYFRVDGGATQTLEIAPNDGASNNAPYTALKFADSDHYSVKLSGLSATSTIEFSTDANFELTSADATISYARAIVCGVKLTDEPINGEGGGNEEPEDPIEGAVTIAEAIAAADNTAIVIENATVIGVYSRGVLVEDTTGKLLVYAGSAVDAKVGDVVKVEGAMATYGGLRQVGTPTVTVTGSTSYTYPTATVMDGAAMDAYLSNPVIQYVEYTGTLAISGYYYNVTVDGAATAVGSLAYVIEGTVDPALNGQKILVKGWTIGFSGGKYVNTMISEVTAAGATEPEEPGDDPVSPEGSTVVLTMSDYFSAAEEIVNTDGTAKTYIFGDFTFSFLKVNNSKSNFNASDSGIRFYQGDVMTIDAGDKTMTKIEFETYGGKTGPFTSNVGSVDGTTWTGSASSVELTASAQVRFKSVTITLAE
nr:BACON domain-containing protein [Alistipes sp.]